MGRMRQRAVRQLERWDQWPRALDAYKAWATYGRKQQLLLDYAPSGAPRWGYGHPSHPGLQALLAPAVARGLDRLRRSGPKAHLADVPVHADPASRSPSWDTGWLSPLDAATLCTVLIEGRPARYLEIGSGTSTKFARWTIERHALPTEVVSIDPEPRSVIDELCDEVIRTGLERCELDRFDELEAGDVLFFDGSHRVLPNSDVVVFFLEVLPRLAPGVQVHIHDIFLPDDYPARWSDRWYSEQYLLATMLLADPGRVEVLAANHLLATAAPHEIDDLWRSWGVDLPDPSAPDGSFWFQLAGS